MATIHEAYAGDVLTPYEGPYEDMTGGEFLGYTDRPYFIGAGGIVTSVSVLDDDDDVSTYWFDPDLRIEGESYVRLPKVSLQPWSPVER